MTVQHGNIQIEKTHWTSVYNMPALHSHHNYEMYFLVSGSRRYFIDDAIYDIEPGNLILIPKTVLHKTLAPSRGSHERYVVYFDDNSISSLIETVGQDAFDRLIQSHCLNLTETASQAISHTLDAMYNEIIFPDNYSGLMLSELLNSILILALRSGTPKAPVSEKNISKMQEIVHYINENLASPLSLREIASIAHMEATYFSKCFKAAVGEGFQEYLTKVRLRKAEQLLEHSRLSVSSIAEACGFSTSNYFGDVFRQRHGSSPSQYRKKIWAEKDAQSTKEVKTLP